MQINKVQDIQKTDKRKTNQIIFNRNKALDKSKEFSRILDIEMRKINGSK